MDRIRCETLNTIFIGEFALASSPRNVEMPATTLAQKPPNSKAAARCMTNEVDPRAATLSLVVVKPSRRVATNKKVPRGHHPGKGNRVA
jgi:hypothetical protein